MRRLFAFALILALLLATAAMGEETFLAALRLFYQRGLAMDVVGEYDFVDALDDASGGDWEAFLTDWLFNVADYYVESYTLDSIE